MLTAEQLREMMDYDAETGMLTWRYWRGNGVTTGRPVGCVHRQTGYRVMGFGGRQYKVHRLAWLHYYGRWPNGDIDHINRDRADNRIANLREVNDYQNAQNSGVEPSRNNKLTGLRGVFKRRDGRKRWGSSIAVNGKRLYLGYYETPQEAHAAYLKAKSELHPFAAR